MNENSKATNVKQQETLYLQHFPLCNEMQADVCHAYQVLKRGGIKDENIVVFMYDDIAMNALNPRKGVLINHPTGEDVYAGVPKVISVFFTYILDESN